MIRASFFPAQFSRFGSFLLKPPIPTLILAALIVMVLITGSVFLDWEASARALSLLGLPKWKSAVSFLLVFFAGGIVGILCYGIGQSGWEECASCFWVPIRRAGFLLAIVGLTFLGFLVWLASAWVNSETKHHYLNLHDPGAIFAAFMGLITNVGFAFTLHDLREMRRRITTFPDLIERLTWMLRKANQDNDIVRFLAYTPALGFIALEDNEFLKFANALHDRGKRPTPPVEMICLSEESLEEWHNLFIGRRTRRKRFDNGSRGQGPTSQRPAKPGEVDPNLAAAATREGEKIVNDILSQTKDQNEHPGVKRLPFEFLPGYYFFLSSDRAIVAAPLQLPFPKGAPKSAQDAHNTVQMLGFETNDRAIIRDLGDLYDSYRKLPSSYIAEHREEIKADKFEKWCASSFQNVNQLLISQFKVACGAINPPPNDDKLRTLQDDYKDYLAPARLPTTKLEMTFRLSLKEEASNS
jgi:hypothetical protein